MSMPHLQSRYRLLSLPRLILLLVAITFGYGVAFQIFPAQWAIDLPDSIVKALKFSAFLLASYPLWNSIGKNAHRTLMVIQSTQGGTADDREYAREQLRLLASDDKVGTRLCVVAFLVLAFLACFGEV